VDLAEMTYLRTGQTWYEKNYGAYLDDKDIPKFNDMKRKLNQLKTSMSWTDFKQFIKGEYPYSEPELQTLFDAAASWQDFFGPLSDKMGMPDFCTFAAPWLHTFFWNVTRYSFAAGTYLIPLKNIPSISYTAVEYKRGGKRFTRKRFPMKRNYQ
jgi:hypothetical protein